MDEIILKWGCEAMTKSLCKEFGFVAGVDVPQEPMSVPLEHLVHCIILYLCVKQDAGKVSV